MAEHLSDAKVLHDFYKDLGISPEVERIVEREVRRARGDSLITGDGDRAERKRRQELHLVKPEARIGVYLNYLRECLSTNDPARREQKLARFKEVLHNEYVIKPDDAAFAMPTEDKIERILNGEKVDNDGNPITIGHFDRKVLRLREQGCGIQTTINEDERLVEIQTIISEQIQTLDAWIDYLASGDALYPDWFKYFAIRNVLHLNRYDKDKKGFTKRTKGSVSPFPDISQYRDALGYVCDALEKDLAGKELDFGSDVNPVDQQQFAKAVKERSFPRMFAWAMEHFNPVPEKLLQNTQGKWKPYPKGSDPKRLVRDISRYSTGWCIRGEPTAALYLSGNDLEIYFSADDKGDFTIPRAAIVRTGNRTKGVRGIAGNENLDSYIGGVVSEKLSTLSDGELFKRRSSDMKELTSIERLYDRKERKWKRGLTRGELVFLYELDSSIQSFGYEKDPRISELQQTRKDAGLLEQDQCLIFECEPSQIAHTQEDLARNDAAGIETKAYIGPLFKGLFSVFRYPERIFTKFPEGKITIIIIEIGGKSREKLQEEMQERNIRIFSDELITGSHILAGKPEVARLVRIKIRDLQLANPTTKSVYEKAGELGFKLCPPEVGPHLRLQYTEQPTDGYLYIGMRPINVSDEEPSIFGLGREDEDLWLFGILARSQDKWNQNDEFVFSL